MLRDIQARTRSVSAALYNSGLKKAEIRDLGGAESCLLCAVELDKYNFRARDLLGLIYMEMGRSGDALSLWSVSSMLSKRNTAEIPNAIAYLKKANSNKATVERMDSAIKLFNQALLFLRQKSEDMAYIQLKKAIELNPNFVDALNLLTLYYIKRRSKDKALALINQTLAIDVYNQTALRYYNELYPKRKLEPRSAERRQPQRTRDASVNQNTGSNPVYKPNIKSNDVRKAERTKKRIQKTIINDGILKRIFSYAVAPVLVFFIMTFFVVPNIMNSRDKTIEENELTISRLLSELDGTGFEKDIVLNELQMENERLTLRINDMQVNARRMAHENVMASIYTNIITGDYALAAMMLETLNVEEVSEDFAEQVERVKQIVYPNASEQFYKNGVARYLDGQYIDAMRDLLNSLYFYADVQGVRDFRDEVNYYLGIITHDSSDFAAAIEYFGTVVDSYKSSPFYYDAVERQKRAQNSFNAVN
jgi:tetratricopeptide (TPR) repeat protein